MDGPLVLRRMDGDAVAVMHRVAGRRCLIVAGAESAAGVALSLAVGLPLHCRDALFSRLEVSLVGRTGRHLPALPAGTDEEHLAGILGSQRRRRTRNPAGLGRAA